MCSRKAVTLIVTALSGLSGATNVWAAPAWVEQGPGPILNGGDQGLPDNPVAGAINAIVASPDSADIILVGTVNGGVWRTSNATGASPTWAPLTDEQLPALSINSLAMSPVRPNTLFAGTGSTSSDEQQGSPGFGVARSTDGGTTWTVLAASSFTGRAINSIVPTRLNGGNVVLAATLCGTVSRNCVADSGSGVYRSTDNGVSFSRISGNGSSGLADAGVSKLIADPSNLNRFYAGVPQQFGGGAQAGVYRSDDGGLTWTTVNTGLTGLSTSLRILLSVHNDATNNVAYAAIIDNGGTLSGVFRSTNQGGNWTSLGAPSPPIFPLGKGRILGAFAADPSKPNVVFISGDAGASVARYTGTAWENVVPSSAHGTSPHVDSRDMTFDANGDLLQANDGGIFRLVSPNTAGTRQWVSAVGNIRSAEFHSVAYDPLSKVVFGGTQDNGTPIQTTPGNTTWSDFSGGDGGVVAVDADQATHPGTTLRYTSSNVLAGFNRSSWNAANTFLGRMPVLLNIVSGPGTGQNFRQFDTNIRLYNPYVLNAIDPSRMLIGTEYIYESLDRGDSLNNLGFVGNVGVAPGLSGGHPLAYGGRLNGASNPDVFYVGGGFSFDGVTILHRVNRGGPIITLSSYPGGFVQTVVMNPQNYRQVFVSDIQNRVWGSFDEGASWIELTANLPSLTSQVNTIEVFSPDTTVRNTVLIAGGFGVFEMRRPAAGGVSWTELSSGFPNALVQDLHYDYTNNVLVAGSLGRGTWTLSGFFRGGSGTGLVASRAASQPSGSADNIPRLDLPPVAPVAIMPTTADPP
jgi:hypothetical protein